MRIVWWRCWNDKCSSKRHNFSPRTETPVSIYLPTHQASLPTLSCSSTVGTSGSFINLEVPSSTSPSPGYLGRELVARWGQPRGQSFPWFEARCQWMCGKTKGTRGAETRGERKLCSHFLSFIYSKSVSPLIALLGMGGLDTPVLHPITETQSAGWNWFIGGETAKICGHFNIKKKQYNQFAFLLSLPKINNYFTTAQNANVVVCSWGGTDVLPPPPPSFLILLTP